MFLYSVFIHHYLCSQYRSTQGHHSSSYCIVDVEDPILLFLPVFVPVDFRQRHCCQHTHLYEADLLDILCCHQVLDPVYQLPNLHY